MKSKILFYMISLLICIVITINNAFSDDECGNKCLIKDETPKIINDYLDNLKKIVKNINGLTKGGKGDSRDIQTLFADGVSWYTYFTNSDFYLKYGTNAERVGPIWRDYKKLVDAISLIKGNGKLGITLKSEDVCKGVKNCTFRDESGKFLLGQILKNHTNIVNFYKANIIGKKDFINDDFLLVDDNFRIEFRKYYNENTTLDCSSCKGGYFDSVKEQFKNISFYQDYAKDGTDNWKKSIALLNGSLENKNYIDKEREVLSKYLSTQGLSMRASNNIIKNLDKYNDKGRFSIDNNFITNTFSYVKDGLVGEFDEFKDSFIQNYNLNKKKIDSGEGHSEEQLPIPSVVNTGKELNNTNFISKRINELYEKEIPNTQNQDIVNDNIEGKIIEIHFNLIKSIENLDKTIPVSKKVCSDQGNGLGNCE